MGIKHSDRPGSGKFGELFTPTWDLNTEELVGRVLEEAFATSDNVLLLRFSSAVIGGADKWIGCKPAFRLVEDEEVVKTVRVLKFAAPLPGDLVGQLHRVAPDYKLADPVPNKVMGSRITGVYSNKTHGLAVPPSAHDSQGWYLEMGVYFVELSWYGLGFHAPKDIGGGGGVQ